MTITRYFQRTISTHTTVRPIAIEVDHDTLVYRTTLYSRSAAFEYIHEYTEEWDGTKITVKIHSLAEESFGMVQFFVVTGVEEAVQKEAEYICHI